MSEPSELAMRHARRYARDHAWRKPERCIRELASYFEAAIQEAMNQSTTNTTTVYPETA